MVYLLVGAAVVEGRMGSEDQGSEKGVSCRAGSWKKSDRVEGV